MDYKAYSMEWSRRRYLEESIQKYFETGATIDTILDDIVDILEKNINHHKHLATRYQDVLDGIKTLPHN